MINATSIKDRLKNKSALCGNRLLKALKEKQILSLHGIVNLAVGDKYS